MSLDYLNSCILNGTKPFEPKFRHSSVYCTKALLEDHFYPRKFTLEEVEDLLKEVFYFNKIKKIKEIIPKWYSDKWFKEDGKAPRIQVSTEVN